MHINVFDSAGRPPLLQTSKEFGPQGFASRPILNARMDMEMASAIFGSLKVPDCVCLQSTRETSV
jgi:hypothetical protein